MPAGNRMGPEGEGSMTGRGMGICAGYPQAGFHRSGFFNHRWAPFGRGGRFRNRYFAYGLGYGFQHASGYGFTSAADEQPPTPEEEEQILQQHASWLQQQLETINARLEKIKKNDAGEA